MTLLLESADHLMPTTRLTLAALAANRARAEEVGRVQADRAARAVLVLQAAGDRAHERWVEALQHRADHPTLTLRQCGETMTPPMSKHQYAALLRRALLAAEDLEYVDQGATAGVRAGSGAPAWPALSAADFALDDHEAERVWPFIEQQAGGCVIGYGHWDSAQFVDVVNEYCRSGSGRAGFSACDVHHVWAVVVDPDVRALAWAGVTSDTPNAFAVTVIHGAARGRC